MNSDRAELKAAVVKAVTEELPRDTWFAVARSALEKDSLMLDSTQKMASVLEQLRGSYREELRSLLGKDAVIYDAFRQRKQRLAADMEVLYTPTPEGDVLKRRLKGQSAAEATELFGRLESDVATVKNMQRAYIGRAATAVEEYINGTDKPPYVLVSPSQVPRRVDNPWTWFSPPYTSKWGWQYTDGSGGARWVSHTENNQTGEMSIQSSMSLHGADDSDHSYTNARSELWVGYRMPGCGPYRGMGGVAVYR